MAIPASACIDRNGRLRSSGTGRGCNNFPVSDLLRGVSNANNNSNCSAAYADHWADGDPQLAKHSRSTARGAYMDAE